jgi:hypothetical protein
MMYLSTSRKANASRTSNAIVLKPGKQRENHRSIMGGGESAGETRS